MGLPGLIMLFLAAFSVAVSLNHLFLASKLKAAKLHISISLAGLLGTAWFVLVFLGYQSPVDITMLHKIYRYHLLLMQMSLLAMVYSYALLIGFHERRWLFSMMALFALFGLITLILPVKYLFSSGPSAVIAMIVGYPVTLLDNNIAYWRMIADITTIMAIFFSLTFLFQQIAVNTRGGKAGLIIQAVLLFVLAGVDHLTDSGTLASIYLLPLGYFVSFSMLSASSLQNAVVDIRKNMSLMQEDRKWRLMAGEMKLIIVELNTLGQVRYANPFFYELTGYKKEEVLGMDWFELALPRSHTYDVQSAFIEILTNEFHPTYENPILTKRKEEKLISWYNVRLRDIKGKITGSISIGVDITELRNDKESLEKELTVAKEMVDKLQEELKIRE